MYGSKFVTFRDYPFILNASHEGTGCDCARMTYWLSRHVGKGHMGWSVFWWSPREGIRHQCVRVHSHMSSVKEMCLTAGWGQYRLAFTSLAMLRWQISQLHLTVVRHVFVNTDDSAPARAQGTRVCMVIWFKMAFVCILYWRSPREGIKHPRVHVHIF